MSNPIPQRAPKQVKTFPRPMYRSRGMFVSLPEEVVVRSRGVCYKGDTIEDDLVLTSLLDDCKIQRLTDETWDQFLTYISREFGMNICEVRYD